ncbi:MAG: peptidylprolyl isomerase [Bacteroidales bacterium]
MRRFIKGLSLLFVLFSTTTLVAQENVVDEVVWVVGDEAILRSQVEEQRLRMQYEGEKINGDPYCVIPEQLAIQKLFLHQAKLDSIEMSESDVLRQVEARMSFFLSQSGSKEKMEEYFNKTSSQMREELRETVRDQGTVEQMQRKLVENVKVTPSEVRRFYQSLPQDSIPFIPAQVEVEVITFEPKVPQAEVDEIKARLRDYTNRVVNGESEFSTLAILYSQDPGSARNGGELGFMGRGQLDPAFASAAFQLNDPKKVSKIVESEYGYHIIQLIEKRSDRGNFRHILLTPKISEKELTQTMARMDSLKADLDSAKFTFEEAALYLSHDKDTRNNHGLMVNMKNGTSHFQMEDLPVEVARQVEKMKVNDISAPFVMKSTKNGREVVSIVKLKTRLEGHKATIYDDYQELKGMLEAKKREEVIKDFIKKKQAETYIRIKEGWRNCDFEYPGWVRN